MVSELMVLAQIFGRDGYIPWYSVIIAVVVVALLIFLKKQRDKQM